MGKRESALLNRKPKLTEACYVAKKTLEKTFPK
jgi:hypothetical protein